MFKNKVVWIIIAIVAILFFWVKGVYNNMVTQDEGVKSTPYGFDPESGKYGKRIRRT